MSTDAFEPTAPALGVLAAVLAAAVAVVATGFGPPGGPLAAIGAVVLLVGVVRRVRRFLVAGAATTFVGALAAGLSGASPAAVLVGAAASVLAWDLGEHALGLGAHVGDRADSRRAVLVHAGASTAFFATVVAVAYAVYRLARGGNAGPAVVLLAGAAALFAYLVDW